MSDTAWRDRVESRLARLEVHIGDVAARTDSAVGDATQLTWEARQALTRAVLSVEEGLQRIARQNDRLIETLAQALRQQDQIESRVAQLEDTLATDREERPARQEAHDRRQHELDRHLARLAYGGAAVGAVLIALAMILVWRLW